MTARARCFLLVCAVLGSACDVSPQPLPPGSYAASAGTGSSSGTTVSGGGSGSAGPRSGQGIGSVGDAAMTASGSGALVPPGFSADAEAIEASPDASQRELGDALVDSRGEAGGGDAERADAGDAFAGDAADATDGAATD